MLRTNKFCLESLERRTVLTSELPDSMMLNSNVDTNADTQQADFATSVQDDASFEAGTTASTPLDSNVDVGADTDPVTADEAVKQLITTNELQEVREKFDGAIANSSDPGNELDRIIHLQRDELSDHLRTGDNWLPQPEVIWEVMPATTPADNVFTDIGR